ncbi:hypothetical protein SAMN05444349_13240 [Bacteroides faecichinchillae]|uniref:Uncharacterized protein n=1 Tax=Bacteroides faecichinchillae TaxID=871325 RepID=A0A1M5E4M6_9BACE|nr:hypothetical protein SAMN05444349_13240 [Bacteroides faecichinchillae]
MIHYKSDTEFSIIKKKYEKNNTIIRSDSHVE